MPVALLHPTGTPKSAAIAPADRFRTAQAWNVLRAAARIEPDHDAVLAWYRDDPIVSLDRRTAEALVAEGRHDEVLTFLDEVHGLGDGAEMRWSAF
ncbi:hypothetical protein EC912_102269 [Luteibacter rhizovicinus]|uniref:DUF2384 domain-containing protein n=1 Tax=Luteibacter rhizovicinus TaxID=242606 RepID=A0A4R3YWU8_9GAMM|nr:hypothetical protein [Luteibacter rhizovicinus]TCV95924.1 hypothetical protein EC912_102269 [Luteibacter rhizovicinus]